MGPARDIARRTFLVGSVAVTGGIAFGIYSYHRPHPNPIEADLVEGAVAITPYVKIDQQGITLITPRADKGQGAYSLQAHLLAEELDVNPHQVNLDPGVPSPAYYNSAVLEEAVPFGAADNSWLAERARGLMQVPAKLLGFQITGGSSTVPDGFEKLRKAGAVARETLKLAASKKTGVPVAQLGTQDAHVILPDGEKIHYTQLARVATSIKPVQDVVLRPATAWRYIGKAVKRTDVLPKSTGAQVYGIDLRFDNMLYATVRANPGMGGSMVSFDGSSAKTMRGVKKIIPIEGGIAVIADNTWRAFKAANAVNIEWGSPPYPATSEEMWQQLDNSLNEDQLDNRYKDIGDVEQSLSGSSVIQAEYRIPYLAHAPLEPMNAVVLAGEDSIDIWTGTQIPRFIQQQVAKRTGLNEEHIRIHVQAMGGSFGRRLELTYVIQSVEIALAVKGTPIKMTWSREEDMTHDYPRPMQKSVARGKVKDGKVEAYDLSIVSASVSSSWFGRLMAAPPGPDITIVAGAWDQPYDIPHYRVSGYRAPEMVPISSWRSVGASGNGFFHDSFLDELCYAAGADPLLERIRLCSDGLSRKVLEAVGEMSSWNGVAVGPNRGRGVAFVLSFGVPVAQVIDVTHTSRGIQIDQVFVACEVGRVVDPINFEAQVSGGVIWGLGHAINCQITYQNHAAQQTNFHQFQGMRLSQIPKINVRGLENGSKIRGIGEPGVPPAAPALANAIFSATGKRLREMPFNKSIDFV